MALLQAKLKACQEQKATLKKSQEAEAKRQHAKRVEEYNNQYNQEMVAYIKNEIPSLNPDDEAHKQAYQVAVAMYKSFKKHNPPKMGAKAKATRQPASQNKATNPEEQCIAWVNKNCDADKWANFVRCPCKHTNGETCSKHKKLRHGSVNTTECSKEFYLPKNQGWVNYIFSNDCPQGADNRAKFNYLPVFKHHKLTPPKVE